MYSNVIGIGHFISIGIWQRECTVISLGKNKIKKLLDEAQIFYYNQGSDIC